MPNSLASESTLAKGEAAGGAAVAECKDCSPAMYSHTLGCDATGGDARRASQGCGAARAQLSGGQSARFALVLLDEVSDIRPKCTRRSVSLPLEAFSNNHNALGIGIWPHSCLGRPCVSAVPPVAGSI